MGHRQLLWARSTRSKLLDWVVRIFVEQTPGSPERLSHVRSGGPQATQLWLNNHLDEPGRTWTRGNAGRTHCAEHGGYVHLPCRAEAAGPDDPWPPITYYPCASETLPRLPKHSAALRAVSLGKRYVPRWVETQEGPQDRPSVTVAAFASPGQGRAGQGSVLFPSCLFALSLAKPNADEGARIKSEFRGETCPCGELIYMVRR